MIHVSVTGYVSRKMVVITGSTTHAAIPITANPRAHQPVFVLGKIAVPEGFGVVGI
jgi:hypothetical protein